MKIIWSLIEENKETKIQLVYNVYWGIKKLYVDRKEILTLRGFNQNDKLIFQHNGNKYKLELIADGYGYTGNLVTPEGKNIPPEIENKRYYKTPLWIIPFVIVNMIIPIIAVEALTPWVIGIFASYLTVKIAQKPFLSIKKRIGISIIISILAWAVYYHYS